VGVCTQLINGEGPFCAIYNLVEGEHTVELVLKPLCCGKDTALTFVSGINLLSQILLHLDRIIN
jgi:hypothetical protein